MERWWRSQVRIESIPHPNWVACRGVDAVEVRIPTNETFGGVIFEFLFSCRRGDGMDSEWAMDSAIAGANLPRIRLELCTRGMAVAP